MNEHHRYRNRIYPTYTSLHSPEVFGRTIADLEYTAKPLLAGLNGWLPANKDAVCLDVACGAGALLFALRQAGYKTLYGVDWSTEQVSNAKLVCENVEQGDAIAYLIHNKEKFDMITAFDIIEHFDKADIFTFVDALFGALKPGGRFIVQTPNADSPWFGTVRYGDFTHELAFTPQSLSRLLKVAGFSQYDSRECRPFVHGFKSGLRAILWHGLRGMLVAWNLIETGGKGSGIHTRVFIAKADKPL